MSFFVFILLFFGFILAVTLVIHLLGSLIYRMQPKGQRRFDSEGIVEMIYDILKVGIVIAAFVFLGAKEGCKTALHVATHSAHESMSGGE